MCEQEYCVCIACEYYKAGTITPCGSACKTPHIKTTAHVCSKHNKLRDGKTEDARVPGENSRKEGGGGGNVGKGEASQGCAMA